MAIDGLYIEATSPDETYGPTRIYPISANIDIEPNRPSTLTMSFASDWAKHSPESGNALQTNSYIEVFENDTTIWEGYVLSKTLIESEGERFIEVTCEDPSGKLADTDAMLAPTAGDNAAANQQILFARTSPGQQLTTDALSNEDIPAIGDIRYPYFFNTSSDIWLGNNYVNTTTVQDDPLTDAAEQITCEGSHNGMYPAGLIKIGSEWIWYDGYIEDGSGNWIMQNCVRGVLGTTAAAHAQDTVIYQQVAKKFHPNYPMIVEGQRNGGSHDDQWDILPEGSYTAQPEEGRIDFNGNPANYQLQEDGDSVAFTYDAFRCTCGVFNEDGGSGVKLNIVIQDLLYAPQEIGGPGLAAGNVAVTIGAAGPPDTRIYLTRVLAPRPLKTLEAIRMLLDELGLLKDSTFDEVAFWYDHPDSTFKVQAIAQAGTPDNTYNSAVEVEQDISLDEVYSAIRVKYTTGQEFNLISPTRLWHQQFTDAGETTGNETMPCLLTSEGAGWRYLHQVQGVSLPSVKWPDDNNLCRGLVCDDRPDTGWGQASDAAGDVDGQVLFGWFPGSNETTPDTFRIRKIRAIVDVRDTVQSANNLQIEVLGSASFTHNGNSIPTFSEKKLSGALYTEYNKGVNLSGNNIVEMEADNIYEDAKCVYIEVTNPQTFTDLDSKYVALIRELEVYGDQVKTVLVKLTGTPADDDQEGDELYSANYSKLLNANALIDQFKCKTIDIGPATKNIAIALGRLALQASLLQTQIKYYRIQDDSATIPELMSTARIIDSQASSEYFQGVVIGIGVRYDGGNRELTLRVLDYTGGLA